MSYDLRLHLVGTGFTVEQADQEASDDSDGVAGPKGRAALLLTTDQQERAIQAIHAADPSLEVLRPEGVDFVQLWGGDDEPRDWCVSKSGVTVSWPYTKTDQELKAVMARVRACLVALYAMGFRAFDPQLDRGLTTPDDLGRDVAESYGFVNQKLADKFSAPIGDARPRIQPGPRRTRPWWRFW